MTNDIIEKERKENKKLYASILFTLDEIEQFVSKETIKRRKYVQLLPSLEKYIYMLDDLQDEEKNKSVLKRIFSKGNNPEDIIESYKRTNSLDLQQFSQCAKCECFDCMRECQMVGCKLCSKSGRIGSCDNKTNTVYLFQNKRLELERSETGFTDVYDVLAIIQDFEYDQNYIIISSRGERFVLYYYPGISGDAYGEISDVDDFNFAITAYEKAIYS